MSTVSPAFPKAFFNARPDPAAHKQASDPRRDSLLRRTLSPGPHFELLDALEPRRAEAESYVAERYLASHHAELTHFLPQLLTMRCLGILSGVAGLAPASTEALFLEHYLAESVEQALTRHRGQEVQRQHIVEIGNLAADQRGASHLLFVLLSAALHRAGYRWLVFTATRALRNNLTKLGFPLLTLAMANVERLPAPERGGWGSYYDSDPQVMAGSLDEAMQLIRQRPLLRRVLRLYRYEINYLAEGLKRSGNV
jgi:hypothetical protein